TRGRDASACRPRAAPRPSLDSRARSRSHPLRYRSASHGSIVRRARSRSVAPPGFEPGLPDPEPLRHYGTATYKTYTNREIVSSVCCESPCRMLHSVRVGSIPGHFSNHQQWRWPMTREEFRAKWNARRTEWEKLGVLLSAGKLCEEFVADFE